MDRRTFLSSNAALCAGFAITKAVPALAHTFPSNAWRTFEVETRVELLNPKGACHIWLPAALMHDTPYQKTHLNHFNADGGAARLTQEKQSSLGVVSATFAQNTKPALTLTSRVSLKNYNVDLSSHRTTSHASHTELDRFLQPARYVPTDGIVKDTALKATAGAVTDVEKARAIYDWVVANTSAIPRSAVAGAAISASCWNRAIWAANVPI